MNKTVFNVVAFLFAVTCMTGAEGQPKTNPAGTRNVQTVTNVEALRATACVPGVSYATQGYRGIADGGDATYVCNGSDTTSPDNGLSIIAGANNNRLYLLVSNTLDVKQGGAYGDGAVLLSNGVTIASGSRDLTVNGANFESTDVGKNIAVPGAGPSGGILLSTIQSYKSPTSVTLASNASTGLSGGAGSVTYGHDDTAAINGVIAYAHASVPANSWPFVTRYSQPRKVNFFSSVYYVQGTLLLPTAIELNLNQSTLVGNGDAAGSNTGIVSAYWKGPALVSTVGTHYESQQVFAARITGGRFSHFGVAMQFQDLLWGSGVTDTQFTSNWQDIIADHCFYAQFFNLTSRESAPLSPSPLAAFDFRNFVNIEMIEGITVTARPLAFQFSGSVNGLTLRNNGAEGGGVGMKFIGLTGPLRIVGNYFEGLTGNALDFTAGAGTNGVDIDGNWFFGVGCALCGTNMTQGRFGRNNVMGGKNATLVNVSDNVSTIKVEIPFTRISDKTADLRPSLPPGYTLGAGVVVDYPFQIFNKATGNTEVAGNYTSTFTPLPFTGQQGFVPGKVAYAATSISGNGGNVNVFVDTRIVYDKYAKGSYSLALADNAGTYYLNGRFYANQNVVAADTAGKPVAVSNNGGFVRLTISAVNAPSGDYKCEGVVTMN